MADAASNVPRCVLKVNVQCCSAYPRKLKKMLMKINGVDAIEIDTENGLVSVRGIVSPSILIETISKKIGQEVEIYAYDKNPEIQNETLDKDKDNDGSACNYDEKKTETRSNFADDKSNDNGKGNKYDEAVRNVVIEHVLKGSKKKKNGFVSWFGKKSDVVAPRMLGGFGGPRPGSYARLPPPPLPPAFQRPMPSYRPGQHPQPQVYPYMPHVPYRITKPPRPYPYDFYEATGPPIGNSVFHTFRDDNVNACSIS